MRVSYVADGKHIRGHGGWMDMGILYVAGDEHMGCSRIWMTMGDGVFICIWRQAHTRMPPGNAIS